MARTVKTGRRVVADSPDRETARTWAALYRQAMESPDRRALIGNEDTGESSDYLYADDPGMLVALLENFAKYGTFKMSYPGIDFDGMAIRGSYEDLLREQIENPKIKKSVEFMLGQLADKYSLSVSTIKSHVKDTRKKFLIKHSKKV